MLLVVLHLILVIYMLKYKPFTEKGALIVNVITEVVFLMILILTIGSCDIDECNNDGWVYILIYIYLNFIFINKNIY